MGEGDDTLEARVAALLAARGYTLALTETVSGGLVAQRLLQADPSCVVEGRILGPGMGELKVEQGVDMGRKQMLDFGSTCALVCMYQQEDESAHVLFMTPEENVTWTIAIVGSGPRSQVRLTVNILEQLRRHLTQAV